jgi:hypothetical protein
MSAELVGEDSVTAVIPAAWQPNENSAAKPKDDIVKHPRVKKPTAMPKTAAGPGCAKKIKKIWMMQLPHGYRHGVWDYYWLSGSEFCRCKQLYVVIFVVVAGKSWMNFPVEAMVKAKRQGFGMIKKKIINPQRVRRIDGGFSFIPHRFVTGGFLAALQQKQLLLYLFLVAVCDRHGLSFYRYDSICSLLQMTVEQYIAARDALIEKDLIAFDDTLFQVLDLPATLSKPPALKPLRNCQREKAPIGIDQMQSIKDILKGIGHD